MSNKSLRSNKNGRFTSQIYVILIVFKESKSQNLHFIIFFVQKVSFDNIFPESRRLVGFARGQVANIATRVDVWFPQDFIGQKNLAGQDPISASLDTKFRPFQ